MPSCSHVMPTSLPQEAKEHYDMLKEDYQKQVQKLTKLVDSGLDTVEFLKASGERCHVMSHGWG